MGLYQSIHIGYAPFALLLVFYPPVLPAAAEDGLGVACSADEVGPHELMSVLACEDAPMPATACL